MIGTRSLGLRSEAELRDASGPRSFADLHAHSRASFDSLASPASLVRTAAARGLTHLAITDHDRIDGALEARDRAAELALGISVIVGEEVRTVLEQTPPELSSDIIDKGMVMSGGGAMLRNIDKLLTQVTGVPCHVAENPLSCVALGTGIALEHFDFFKKSLVSQI